MSKGERVDCEKRQSVLLVSVVEETVEVDSQSHHIRFYRKFRNALYEMDQHCVSNYTIADVRHPNFLPVLLRS